MSKTPTIPPSSSEAGTQSEQSQTAEHATRDRASARPDGGPAELDAPPSNTASNNSNTGCFIPLRWGVDSLYLSYQGELSFKISEQLHRLKELAQSSNPGESAQAQFKLGDHVFEVKDKGSKLFAYTLEDNAFRIQLAKPGRKVPMAYVKVSAVYLAHVGPRKAEAAVYELLNALGEIQGSANASRIDLYVDFVSTLNMESWGREAWVTRAHGINSHSVEGTFTGWSIGLGGVMGARLYNKLLELVSSGKGWLIPLWQEVGWQPGEPVWRLEFEFKRELLTQKGLSSFYDVMHHLNGLWSYATTEWLRLALPNHDDSTRSRWPIHPLWACLASIDWETKGGPLSKRFSPTRSPNDDRLCAMHYSTLLSYMAKHGLDDLYDGVEDLNAVAYEHHNRQAAKLGLSFDDYIAEKLAVKRRQYNTKLNNPGLIEALDEDALDDEATAYRKASKGG